MVEKDKKVNGMFYIFNIYTVVNKKEGGKIL